MLPLPRHFSLIPTGLKGLLKSWQYFSRLWQTEFLTRLTGGNGGNRVVAGLLLYLDELSFPQRRISDEHVGDATPGEADD
jgi:hypothetical protein